MKRRVSRIAMNLKVPPTLWYENDAGVKWVPPIGVSIPPHGFKYQHSQFPNYLRHTVLKLVQRDEVDNCTHPKDDVVKTYGWIDGIEGRECQRCKGTQVKSVDVEWPEKWDAEGSRDLFAGESGYQEDLVLAMAKDGRYTLGESILLVANACERCMNSLAHKYGLKWGYPEKSEKWKKTNTQCDYCESMGTYKPSPPTEKLVRVSRKRVANAASAVRKTEAIADKAAMRSVRNSMAVEDAIGKLADEIESRHEGGNKLKEVMREVPNKVKKQARSAVFGAIVEGLIKAAEKVTGKKAGSLKKLIRIFVKKAAPMAVFGFIDNVILVLVGEVIDRSIAKTLGISTMAAAGLGNATSDAVGVLGQETVDKALDKVGLGPSDVENDVPDTALEKFVSTSGGVIGIIVGCLVGMIPLLFMGKTASGRRAGDLSKKNVIGAGTIQYGGHAPKYLRIVVDDDVRKFLDRKRREVDAKYGTELKAPDELHVTVALGDELKKYGVPKRKIAEVVGHPMSLCEYGDLYRFTTPSDGQCWVVPVGEKEIIKVRRYLGLPERMEAFDNYAFHTTLGYEDGKQRVARVAAALV